MANLNARPYRALTPGNIATADFPPPFFPPTSQRTRAWRNNDLVAILQRYPQAIFGGPNFAATILTGATAYSLPAQNPDGSWKLCPIPLKNQTGPQFDPLYAMYGQTAMLCIQDLRPFFPLGLPYAERVTIADNGMQDMVRGIDPPVPYPLPYPFPSDQILIPGELVGQPGALLTANYQELTAYLRPSPTSNMERLAMIANILAGSSSPDDKITLITHVLMTGKVEGGLT